jgi:glycosyltransferase involved in cell wall biosynthesis
MKIALVHEWLDQYAGSERVLEQLIAMYPEADIFTLVDFMSPADRVMLAGRPVTTSFLQKLPFARRKFRNYLALMPIAIEQFALADYDLVISSSHAVAKGVITGPNQVHVSYVHSPMRYAWDLQAQYLQQGGLQQGLKSLYARWLLHRLRLWDMRTANGVDRFVANSRSIAARIHKVYRREAIVVHPPVDVERFALGEGARDAYLVASRFVPYKRVDLVVEAFRAMPDRRLIVVGAGSEADKIEKLAAGAGNITLRPPVSQAELVTLLQQARAFVFAAEEDFGIGLVEAQACGTPLIAYGRGGARDIAAGTPPTGTSPTGTPPTGVLFDRQDAAAIIDAVNRFEALPTPITPAMCRANAMRFSHATFHTAMRAVVDQALADRHI